MSARKKFPTLSMANKTESTIVTCSKHKKKDLIFYCNACNVMICDDCVVGVHYTHNKTKLNEYGNDVILSVSEICNNTIPKITSLTEQSANAKRIFNESIDQEIETIRINKELIRKMLDDLHDDLIKNLEDARKKGNENFDRFTSNLTQKYDSFKEIMEIIKSKIQNITQGEISLCQSNLDHILNKYSFSEEVPKIDPPRYRCSKDYIKKENLQNFIGRLSLGDNEPLYVVPTRVVRENVNEGDKGSDCCEALQPPRKNEKNKSYTMVKSFRYTKKVNNIVPKQSYLTAWLIGQDITDLNFNTVKPTITLLTKLDGTLITAAGSRQNGLLIGLIGKNCIKQLQSSSGAFRQNVFRVVPFFNVELDSLSAMCASAAPRDVTLCYRIEGSKFFHTSENYFEIHWYSASRQKISDISISSSNVEIDAPTHICEDNNGDLCITCSPVGRVSWVLLLDKNGNQKMRYPPNVSKDPYDGKPMLYSFLGSGFLSDGTITILDRVKFRQHLIDRNGKVLQIDVYDSEPSCLAVDKYDNIWVGFEDGTIQIMNYINRYESIYG